MASVSLIVPCYNAAATLGRALESVLSQPEVGQVWVVDDGSADRTLSVAWNFRARDSRVSVLPMPFNGGPAKARNWGALHASHPLLAFLDADDEYLPMALAAAVDFMENNPRKASVRLDVEFHGFPAEITEHPDFNDAADVLSNTVSSSLVIRRSAYLALGGFPIDECFRLHGGEDGALSLALTRTFGNHRLDDRRRVRMHYHAGIHAERYFRSRMGMPVASADPGTTQQTFVAADEAKRRILELRQLRVRST